MEKDLFCFCHWGGENSISPDGSITYIGGITNSLNFPSGMNFGEFVTMVYEKLALDPAGKQMHFTVKFDYKQLILMKDDTDFHTFIHLNDGFGHVYVSNAENAGPSDTVNGNIISETLINHDQAIQSAASIWDDIIIGHGQVFEDANHFRVMIYKYSIAHRFPYKYTHNKPSYLKVKCGVDGCSWKISAMRDGNTDQVSIRKFDNLHKHSVEDLLKFKPKYNSKLLGDIFTEKIFSSPSYLPRQICKDSWSDYHFEMSYQQAWKVKEQAKLFLDGSL